MKMAGRLANARIGLEHWSLLRLKALGQKIHPRYVKAPHLLTGARGEFEALFFLRRQGYVIVERRWRCPEFNGDIDLIGWEGERLCMIEVKTRTARDRTPAAASIDDAKRRILRNMARAYRRTLPHRSGDPYLMRFDIVSVYLQGSGVECELIRGAFLLHPESRRNEASQFGV